MAETLPVPNSTVVYSFVINNPIEYCFCIDEVYFYYLKICSVGATFVHLVGKKSGNISSLSMH